MDDRDALRAEQDRLLSVMRDGRGVLTYSAYREALRTKRLMIEDIRRHYLNVFGHELPASRCSQRHYDAIFEIERRLKEMKENPGMKPATAVLKNGVVLQDFATGAAYTNKNLTDEFAIEYLKKYPAQSKLFAVLPKVVAAKQKAAKKE